MNNLTTQQIAKQLFVAEQGRRLVNKTIRLTKAKNKVPNINSVGDESDNQLKITTDINDQKEGDDELRMEESSSEDKFLRELITYRLGELSRGILKPKKMQ